MRIRQRRTRTYLVAKVRRSSLYEQDFDIPPDCPSEAEVRLQVRKDEEAAAASSKATLQGSSATAFLTGGIQIEDAQYVGELRILTLADDR